MKKSYVVSLFILLLTAFSCNADFTMPNLVGMEYLNAWRFWRDTYNGQFWYEHRVYDETIAKNYIISHTPVAGTTVSDFVMPSVYISLGPEPVFVSLPDYVNMDVDDVLTAISNEGLVASVTYQENNSYNIGIVFDQDPESGEVVAEGSSISLLVSQGIKVPDIVSMSAINANQTITGAGLSVGVVSEIPSPTVPEGVVIFQIPENDSFLNPGWQVDYVLSSGNYQNELEGSGVAGDPYLISSMPDLFTFISSENSNLYWSDGVYTELANNIVINVLEEELHLELDENFEDSSINDYTVNDYGNIGFGSDSVREYFASFNASNLDYIEIEDYKGIGGSNPRTVCMWVNTVATGTRQGIIGWGDQEEGEYWAMVVESDGRLSCTIWNGIIQSPSPLVGDQWHHVAVSFPGGSGAYLSEASMYIDGVKVDHTNDIDGVVLTGNSQDVHIGGLPDVNSTFHFSGSIDDVMIFEKALTSGEIYLIYENYSYNNVIIGGLAIEQYEGNFNGNGFAIKDLSIEVLDYYDGVGLFGQIGTNGSVSNLILENACVKSVGTTGVLSGYNSGAISNCYVSGNASSYDPEAEIGLITAVNDGGTINNCYSSGPSQGEYDTGVRYQILSSSGLIETLAAVAQDWKADDGEWTYDTGFSGSNVNLIISSNGYIDIDRTGSTPDFSAENLLWPNDCTARLAPLWSDLTTENGDILIYDGSNDLYPYVKVIWNAHDKSGNTCNFAVSYFENGRVLFEYGEIEISSDYLVGAGYSDGSVRTIVYEKMIPTANLSNGNSIFFGAYDDLNENTIDDSFEDLDGNTIVDSFELFEYTEVPSLSSGQKYVDVSDDGTIMIIADPLANGTGQVWLYKSENLQWVLEDTLYPTGGLQSGDLFGNSIAISSDGNVIVVGAPGSDYYNELSTVEDTGAVFIFERHATFGMRSTKVYSSLREYADGFAETVAISGDGQNVISCSVNSGYFASITPDDNTASVISNWEISDLVNVNPENLYFGYSIAVSEDGDTVLVGSPAEDELFNGKVYIYSGSSQVKVYDGNEQSFGSSVDVSADGNTIVVGAPSFGYGNMNYCGTGLQYSSGAVYLYKYDAEWPSNASEILQPLLMSSDTKEFGYSVAISPDGMDLVVGAPKDDLSSMEEDTGAVYYFRRDVWNEIYGWTYISKLVPIIAGSYSIVPGDQFGSDVAYTANGIAVSDGNGCVVSGKNNDCNRNLIPDSQESDTLSISSVTIPDELTTIGGGEMIIIGNGFVEPLDVEIYSQECSVNVPDVDIIVSHDGSTITIANIPAMSPGSMVADTEYVDVNIRVRTKCEETDLYLDTNNTIRYQIYKEYVSSEEQLLSALNDNIDDAGTAIIMSAGNYVFPAAVSLANKSLMTISGYNPNIPSMTIFNGSSQGNDDGKPVLSIENDSMDTGNGVFIVGLNIRCGSPGIQISEFARPVVKWCNIDDCFGGGIEISGNASFPNPVVTNCIIEMNQSGSDGGGISVSSSSAVIINNTISSNYVSGSVNGGGIYIDSCSDIQICGNYISGNVNPVYDGSTSDLGSLNVIDGGGICIEGKSSGLIANNTISGHYVSGNGAGIFISKDSSIDIVGNIIKENHAQKDTSKGGGIYVKDMNIKGFYVQENIITANSAQVGGAFYASIKNNTRIYNNIIFKNKAQAKYNTQNEKSLPYYAAGIYITDSEPQIMFNSIYNNTGYGSGSEDDFNQSGGIHAYTVKPSGNYSGNGLLTHTVIKGNIIQGNTGYQSCCGNLANNFRGNIIYNITYGSSAPFDIDWLTNTNYYNINTLIYDDDLSPDSSSREAVWDAFTLAGGLGIGYVDQNQGNDGCNAGAVQVNAPDTSCEVIYHVPFDGNANYIVDKYDLISDGPIETGSGAYVDDDWDGVIDSEFTSKHSFNVLEIVRSAKKDMPEINNAIAGNKAATITFTNFSVNNGSGTVSSLGGNWVEIYGSGLENITSVKFISSWYTAEVFGNDSIVIENNGQMAYIKTPVFTPPPYFTADGTFDVNILLNDGIGDTDDISGLLLQYSANEIWFEETDDYLLASAIEYVPAGTCIVLAEGYYFIDSIINIGQNIKNISIVSMVPYSATLFGNENTIFNITESNTSNSGNNCFGGLVLRLGGTNAVLIKDTNPVFFDCVFENNVSAFSISGKAAPVINYCLCQYSSSDAIIISDEASPALVNNDIFGNGGTGIRVNGSSKDCIIYSNIIDNNDNGGVVLGDISTSFAKVVKNKITNNTTSGNGAGLYISKNANPFIYQNYIIDNSCMGTSGQGGGIYIESFNLYDLEIRDNHIAGNSSQTAGGAVVFNHKCQARFEGNVVFKNEVRPVKQDTADDNGVFAPGILINDAIPYISHNTIVDNVPNTAESGSNTTVEPTGDIHGMHILAGARIVNNIIDNKDKVVVVHSDYEITSPDIIQYNLVYNVNEGAGALEDCFNNEIPLPLNCIYESPNYDTDIRDLGPDMDYRDLILEDFSINYSISETAQEGRDFGALQRLDINNLPLYITFTGKDTNYNSVPDEYEIQMNMLYQHAGWQLESLAINDANSNLIFDDIENNNSLFCRNITRGIVYLSEVELQQVIDEAQGYDIILIYPGQHLVDASLIYDYNSIVFSSISPTNWDVVRNTELIYSDDVNSEYLLTDNCWRSGMSIFGICFGYLEGLCEGYINCTAPNLLVSNCIFEKGYATSSQTRNYIYDWSENSVIQNCSFVNVEMCTNPVTGDNVYFANLEELGQYIYLRDYSTLIYNCTFSSPTPAINRPFGHVIYNLGGQNTKIRSCIFTDLRSDNPVIYCGSYMYYGYHYCEQLDISNSIFSNCQTEALLRGAVLYRSNIKSNCFYSNYVDMLLELFTPYGITNFENNLVCNNESIMSLIIFIVQESPYYDTESIISHSTVVNNRISSGEILPAMYFYGPSKISNSIVWGNIYYDETQDAEIINYDSQIFPPVDSDLLISYSCIDDGVNDGTDPIGFGFNTNVDPIFINPGEGDFRLNYDSPLLDYAPISELEIEYDIRGVGFNRGVDLDDAGYATWTNDYGRYDLGAYEMNADIDYANQVIELAVASGQSSMIKMKFDYPVIKSTAEKASNYQIGSNAFAVSELELQEDGKTVIIQTSPLTEGKKYSVSVDNVESIIGVTTPVKVELIAGKSTVPGDIDLNLKVDFADLNMFTYYWLTENDAADFGPGPEGDNFVDIYDFMKMSQQWLVK